MRRIALHGASSVKMKKQTFGKIAAVSVPIDSGISSDVRIGVRAECNQTFEHELISLKKVRWPITRKPTLKLLF
jgi:hypothetical protein